MFSRSWRGGWIEIEYPARPAFPVRVVRTGSAVGVDFIRAGVGVDIGLYRHWGD